MQAYQAIALHYDRFGNLLPCHVTSINAENALEARTIAYDWLDYLRTFFHGIITLDVLSPATAWDDYLATDVYTGDLVVTRNPNPMHADSV